LRITHHESRITPMKWFVAVSGNIGSGKSTVTTVLSEKLGWNHDRTIYEDAEIFARNLYLQGLMDERDFRNYYELFNTMLQFLRPPDLILYLQAPVQILLERIHRRARDFEQRIPPAYLQQLNERYAEWVERFRLCPILTVDAERLDLAHLDSLVAEMQARLPSLFPLIER